MENDLVIGKEQKEKSNGYILGEPVAIRTDKNGNIFIADRASLTVKIFDKKGNYLRSFGGRGRGPGEFLDIRLMEFTPSGDFLFLDKNNLRYTILSKDGVYKSSNSIRLDDQFYFKDIEFVEGNMIGLYLSSRSVSEHNEIYNRNIFHVFSGDMKEKHRSFATPHQLGIEDWFGWNTLSIYLGSMEYIKDLNVLLYSPGIYSGALYLYKRDINKSWALSETFQGTPPHFEPYILYDSEAQYQASKKFPGVTKINYAGKAGRGKLNSMNAGLFYLPKREQIIQFYAEWREGEVTLEEGNLLDLSMQIFDLEGNVIEQSYLTSIEHGRRTDFPLINWMDEDENFYMIDPSSRVPLVRRFSLGLPK